MITLYTANLSTLWCHFVLRVVALLAPPCHCGIVKILSERKSWMPVLKMILILRAMYYSISDSAGNKTEHNVLDKIIKEQIHIRIGLY